MRRLWTYVVDCSPWVELQEWKFTLMINVIQPNHWPRNLTLKNGERLEYSRGDHCLVKYTKWSAVQNTSPFNNVSGGGSQEKCAHVAPRSLNDSIQKILSFQNIYYCRMINGFEVRWYRWIANCQVLLVRPSAACRACIYIQVANAYVTYSAQSQD